VAEVEVTFLFLSFPLIRVTDAFHFFPFLRGSRWMQPVLSFPSPPGGPGAIRRRGRPFLPFPFSSSPPFTARIRGGIFPLFFSSKGLSTTRCFFPFFLFLLF